MRIRIIRAAARDFHPLRDEDAARWVEPWKDVARPGTEMQVVRVVRGAETIESIYDAEMAAPFILREVEKAESKLVNLIDGDRDDSILEVYNGKVNVLKKVFDVSDLELETMKGDGIRLEDTLTWLIVERGALLSTEH